MPTNVISKPPTAELRPGQKDEDSLPPYSDLDRILEALVDKDMSVRETAVATGEPEELVAKMEQLVLRAEALENAKAELAKLAHSRTKESQKPAACP